MTKRIESMKHLRTMLVMVAALVMFATASFSDEPERASQQEKETTQPGRSPSVAQEARPAVVRIRASEGDAASYGSGTLVGCTDKHGVVLTNWHVVRDATGQISVRFPDGFRSAATVVDTDETWDLAALMIWRPEAKPVPIASEMPQRGDKLTIAGYGSGTYREATGKVTQYVSPGDDEPFEMVEVNVEARSGDSGGPILNGDGQIAAVLFGSAEGHTNGSHCRRVRWFVRRALRKTPKLAACVFGKRNKKTRAVPKSKLRRRATAR